MPWLIAVGGVISSAVADEGGELEWIVAIVAVLGAFFIGFPVAVIGVSLTSSYLDETRPASTWIKAVSVWLALPLVGAIWALIAYT